MRIITPSSTSFTPFGPIAGNVVATYRLTGTISSDIVSGSIPVGYPSANGLYLFGIYMEVLNAAATAGDISSNLLWNFVNVINLAGATLTVANMSGATTFDVADATLPITIDYTVTGYVGPGTSDFVLSAYVQKIA